MAMQQQPMQQQPMQQQPMQYQPMQQQPMQQQPMQYQPMQQQPMQQQQMVTMVTTTNSTMGSWSTGLCDCFKDMGVCCCGLWCFSCLQCKTANDFGWCCCVPMCDSAACFVISCQMRASVRKQYGIPGSCCDDCMSVLCCYVCVWCQMAREINIRKSGQTNTMTVVTTQPLMATH